MKTGGFGPGAAFPPWLSRIVHFALAIVDLGGEPTTTPKPIEKTTTLREMLELDLNLELQDVEEYTKHAELAGELGEVELKLKLEEMAADEAGHARELRRILKGF